MHWRMRWINSTIIDSDLPNQAVHITRDRTI